MGFKQPLYKPARARRPWAGALLLCAVLVSAAGLPRPGLAQGTYLERGEFLQQAFDGPVPEPDAIWLTGEMQASVREILGHDYPGLRIRYWVRGDRSAWILEEIGKERPITTGFVVDDQRLVAVRVLIFRESRGWEVRYPYFTEQFENAGLAPDGKLDRRIDNITGATLSVNAIRRLARLALFLNRTRKSGIEDGEATE